MNNQKENGSPESNEEAPQQKKGRVGRPRWSPPELDMVERMAGRGLTQRQIALALGICLDTLIKYKKENSEFFDSIQRGKAQGLYQVSNALFAEAVQGSVTAQMFYLKCRDRENWNDKPHELKEMNDEIR